MGINMSKSLFPRLIYNIEIEIGPEKKQNKVMMLKGSDSQVLLFPCRLLSSPVNNKIKIISKTSVFSNKNL